MQRTIANYLYPDPIELDEAKTTFQAKKKLNIGTAATHKCLIGAHLLLSPYSFTLLLVFTAAPLV